LPISGVLLNLVGTKSGLLRPWKTVYNKYTERQKELDCAVTEISAGPGNNQSREISKLLCVYGAHRSQSNRKAGDISLVPSWLTCVEDSISMGFSS
jgi:hypothetical protein